MTRQLHQAKCLLPQPQGLHLNPRTWTKNITKEQTNKLGIEVHLKVKLWRRKDR